MLSQSRLEEGYVQCRQPEWFISCWKHLGSADSSSTSKCRLWFTVFSVIVYSVNENSSIWYKKQKTAGTLWFLHLWNLLIHVHFVMERSKIGTYIIMTRYIIRCAISISKFEDVRQYFLHIQKNQTGVTYSFYGIRMRKKSLKSSQVWKVHKLEKPWPPC